MIDAFNRTTNWDDGQIVTNKCFMWTSIQAVNCTKYNTVIQLKSDSLMLPNLGKCQNSGGKNQHVQTVYKMLKRDCREIAERCVV